MIVSRADASLVQRLFEMEVPEIYDGTVQIRAAAREAGERTKVAVASRDKDVDPVGACVGMKGMRVQSIIRELRGEKIDIIPYNEETVAFAQKALSPAKVTRVQITDPENKKLEVIVEDSQLSLAIGKKGQNVRLASKLIGWDIDIKSEEEKRREIEEQMTALTAPTTPLTVLAGVGPKTIEKDRSGGNHFAGKTGQHDTGTTDGDSGHRRKDGRQDLPGGEPLLRGRRSGCGDGGRHDRCSRRNCRTGCGSGRGSAGNIDRGRTGSARGGSRNGSRVPTEATRRGIHRGESLRRQLNRRRMNLPRVSRKRKVLNEV